MIGILYLYHTDEPVDELVVSRQAHSMKIEPQPGGTLNNLLTSLNFDVYFARMPQVFNDKTPVRFDAPVETVMTYLVHDNKLDLNDLSVLYSKYYTGMPPRENSFGLQFSYMLPWTDNTLEILSKSYMDHAEKDTVDKYVGELVQPQGLAAIKNVNLIADEIYPDDHTEYCLMQGIMKQVWDYFDKTQVDSVDVSRIYKARPQEDKFELVIRIIIFCGNTNIDQSYLFDLRELRDSKTTQVKDTITHMLNDLKDRFNSQES